MLEEVRAGDQLFALIIRSHFRCDGIKFFTPDDYSQQLAYMNRPAGYVIEPHLHNPVRREVHRTQEVLFIRSGKVRIDFYDDDKAYLESRDLASGDVILLVSGGHGLVMLEACEIVEVKQGPYVGEADKTRFASELPENLKYSQSE